MIAEILSTARKKLRQILDYAAAPPPPPPPPPSWVLLDYLAFTADHPNATTARGFTRTGQPVEVSFWTAPPPRVSYICVHCPGRRPGEFAVEPEIIRAEADLVLFRLAFGHPENHYSTKISDLFVYQATTPTPQLRLIPRPVPAHFADHDIGLLRHDGGGFTVAALAGAFKPGKRDYVVYLYRSASASACTDQGWTAHHVSVREDGDGAVVPPTSTCSPSSKVIAVGGEAGTMGWVDLHNGILFCDLLSAGGPGAFRYLPLPPPILPRDDKDGPFHPLPPRRDIALVQGRIKYTELHPHVPASWVTRHGFDAQGWTAAIWSLSATDPWKEDWVQDCSLHASEVSFDDALGELLPKHPHQPQEPVLERLHPGLPRLSLLGDDVVYYMAKATSCVHNAWVLAVDMRNKKLKSVAKFDAQRTDGTTYTFINTRISDYLPGINGNLKRPEIPLSRSSRKRPFRIRMERDGEQELGL